MSLSAIAAADRFIDPKSTLSATFAVEKVPVWHRYKFSGHIDYDPANPTAAKSSLEVQTASMDIGSADYNEEVQGKKWFDVRSLPQEHVRLHRRGRQGPRQIAGHGQPHSQGQDGAHHGAHHGEQGRRPDPVRRRVRHLAQGLRHRRPQWNDVLEDNVKVKFHLLQ